MEVLLERCAGIDVHKAMLMVCVRRMDKSGRTRKSVQEFGTTTAEILRMADWMARAGVTHAAMESTGVFWKPLWNLLEGRFELVLCNAQHIKRVPGRKTDVQDCEWIAQLLQHGLLEPSFVPERPMRELRDLTRHRARMVEERTRAINRIDKVLQDANIKLTSVTSKTLGASGRAMLEAMLEGAPSAEELAEMARGRLRSKIPQLREALEGQLREHHRFMLRMLLEHLMHLEGQIEAVSKRIEQVMAPGCAAAPAQQQPEPPSPPPAQPQPPSVALPPEPQAPAGPLPPMSLEQAVELLDTIPGVDKRSAQNILAEFGTDMSHFPTSAHAASWAGLCPGTEESAGKRKGATRRKGNRWLGRTLVQCAWASVPVKTCYFSAQFRRLVPRRGKQRALLAVAHSMFVSIYHMLKNHTPFRDLGADHFDRLTPERVTRHLVKRLERLGHKVTLEPQAALAS